MQTILGSSGQIGQELARCIAQDFTQDIRLVSRQPSKVNSTDSVFAANLLDPQQTMNAVKGASIAYLTAGLPMDTKRWIEQWPVMMRNVINACVEHKTKLVFFDNTYMYPQTSDAQTEQTSFKPYGAKGRVRAQITNDLLRAIDNGRIEGLICRAPEFYGPGITQSITNATILEKMQSGTTAKVFLRDDTLRSLIFTPDASRGMALLGNTPDAFGQTWHLPCDDNRLTYKQFIELAAKEFGVEPNYKVVKRWQLGLAGMFNAQIRDAAELLPRYQQDNIFVSDKFKKQFPEFSVTCYLDGLAKCALGKYS